MQNFFSRVFADGHQNVSSQTSLHRSAMGQQGRRRRLSSSASDPAEVSPGAEARVLVINTGGTIGMMYHDNVLSPEPNALVKALKKLPILHDELYTQQTRLYDHYGPSENTLVLPMPTHHADELSKGSGSTDSLRFGCLHKMHLQNCLSVNVCVCVRHQYRKIGWSILSMDTNASSPLCGYTAVLLKKIWVPSG